MRPRGLDHESFRLDLPPLRLVELQRDLAGIAPELADVGLLADEAFKFPEHTLAYAAALVVGGDGHPAQLPGGSALPLIEVARGAADVSGARERADVDC